MVDEIAEIVVDEDSCSGCAVCIAMCPYDALSLKEKGDKKVLEINLLRCKRCGACVTACPSKAITIKDDFNKTLEQVYEKIKKKENEICVTV